MCDVRCVCVCRCKQTKKNDVWTNERHTQRISIKQNQHVRVRAHVDLYWCRFRSGFIRTFVNHIEMEMSDAGYQWLLYQTLIVTENLSPQIMYSVSTTTAVCIIKHAEMCVRVCVCVCIILKKRPIKLVILSWSHGKISDFFSNSSKVHQQQPRKQPQMLWSKFELWFLFLASYGLKNEMWNKVPNRK